MPNICLYKAFVSNDKHVVCDDSCVESVRCLHFRLLFSVFKLPQKMKSGKWNIVDRGFLGLYVPSFISTFSLH